MSVFQAMAIVALLAINGFFVGAEFALISARRTQIEPMAAAGSRRARAVLTAMDGVPRMLAAAQLGVTLASLALGAVGEPAVAHALQPIFEAVGLPDSYVHPTAFAIALLLVVSAHVIIGEMVPKNLALSGPDKAAVWIVPPLLVVARLTRPILWLVQVSADVVLRLLRIPHAEEVRSVYTSAELPALIDESRRYRLLDQDEHDRMIAALALRARTADSVMVPLADVVSLPATTTAAQLQEQAGRHGHSRFPVYDDHPARLRGYLHVLDALNDHPPDVALPARSLPRVSAQASLDDVLATMRDSRAQLAAIVDADDTAIGVVTLDDVLAGILRRPSRAGA